MEIALNSRARKVGLFGTAFLLSTTFIAASTMHFLADLLSRTGAHLPLAARLDPDNAQYAELMGRELLRKDGDIDGALQQYRRAAALNPNDSAHWLAIADAEQLRNNVLGQRYALERATEADPTTPHVAWSAANFFLAQGDNDAALREFKVVLENDAAAANAVFALSTHVADVPEIIANELPPDPQAFLSFLTFLTAQRNSAGAAEVWQGLTRLGKPFEPGLALAYIDYLIAQHDIPAARLAWHQSAELCGLSAYLPSSDNLIVNPNFDSEILNQGFDWHYQRQANVELSLDPSELHGGYRSLSVTFDGPGVTDAGIAQLVPAEPNTEYEFSAYYKAAAVEGAGGPKLDIQDAYTGTHYFASDDLRNAEVWHEVDGKFRTGPEAQLLALRLVRVPAGSPIRGRLWIDDLRLVEKETEF
jgi:tetratricopeptide (TPR) repeat protein